MLDTSINEITPNSLQSISNDGGELQRIAKLLSQQVETLSKSPSKNSEELRRLDALIAQINRLLLRLANRT